MGKSEGCEASDGEDDACAIEAYCKQVYCGTLAYWLGFQPNKFLFTGIRPSVESRF